MATTIADNETAIKKLEDQVNANALKKDDGTHYQAANTYFYVPRDFGNASTGADTADDDGVVLGAVLRLGAYSDLENDAYYGSTNRQSMRSATPAVYDTYYPPQHIADETGTTIYTNAGGDSTSGILLACDGRVLVQAGEKIYINSDSDMHIESGAKFDIKAGDDINIKSASGKNITITAGDEVNGNYDGTVTQNSGEVRTTIAGNEFVHTEKDSRTTTVGNVFGLTWGSKTFLTGGATISGHFGGGLSVSAAAKLNLNLGPVFTVGLILEYEYQFHSCSFTHFSSSFHAISLQNNKTNIANDALKIKNTTAQFHKSMVTLANMNVKLNKISGAKVEKSEIDMDTAWIDLALNEMTVTRSNIVTVI